MIPNTWITDESPEIPGGERRYETEVPEGTTLEKDGTYVRILSGHGPDPWPERPWPGWRLAYRLPDRGAAVYAYRPMIGILRAYAFVQRLSWALPYWLGFLDMAEGAPFWEGRLTLRPWKVHQRRRERLERLLHREARVVSWREYGRLWWRQRPWSDQWL